MARPVSRRTFLVTGGAAVAGVAIALVIGRSCSGDEVPVDLAGVDTDTLRDRLAAFVSEPADVAALGGVAASMHALSASSLVERLADGDDPTTWLRDVDDAAFTVAVRDSARRDYVSAQLLPVDAWQLSWTETELSGVWAALA